MRKKRFAGLLTGALGMALMAGMMTTPAFGASEGEVSGVTYGSWVYTDSAPFTAEYNKMGLVYHAQSSFSELKAGDPEKQGLRPGDNGSAGGDGIVVTSGKAYIDYTPKTEGTLTIYAIAGSSGKVSYISKTKDGVNTALGSFAYSIAEGEELLKNDEVKVTSGKTWSTIEIEVDKGATYYFCTSGSKMICYGGEFAGYTAVSGKVTGGDDSGELKFVSSELGVVKTVSYNGGEYATDLKSGAYRVSVTGEQAKRFAVSETSKNLTVSSEASQTANIALVEAQTTTLSGNLIGFDSDRVPEGAKVLFVPSDPESFETMEAECDQNRYSVTLMQGEEYSVELSAAYEYLLSQDVKVKAEQEFQTQDINVEKAPLQSVSGKLIGLTDVRGSYEDLTVKPDSISFKNVDDGFEYSGEAAAGSYTASLRKGVYLASVSAGDYSTSTHVTVDDKAVIRDLLLVTKKSASVTKASDIYVGYPDKGALNYASVSAAVKAATAMAPASESDRVTIHIAPGTYREQVYVDVPYITLTSEKAGDVVLTWYYGIGYKYYSVSPTTQYYDAERDYDKYEKTEPKTWGTTVYLTSKAKGFKSENIIFENSFNRAMTDEEMEDGVEPSASMAARNYSLDVKSKAATERACAMYVTSDEVEFRNCEFLSSQDTLGTGSSSTDNHIYFKDCFIEGQTDYICGGNNVVFDTCVLSFKGYSVGATGGYLTAFGGGSGGDNKASKGYLFRNCAIVKNKSLNYSAGYLGRPWAKAATAKVLFFHTKFESTGLILPEGWTDMSADKAAQANLTEYDSRYFNGEAVDMSDRISGKKTLTDDEAKAVNVKDYFGSWTPSYYKAEDAAVSFATKPVLLNNGDINAPQPGNTLSVGYSLGEANDANDASLIKWYAVKDGVETLVYASSAVYGNSYKLTANESGCTIKVVVESEVTSGAKGSVETVTLDNKIGTDYYDPDAKGADMVLGDGVNVFIAGDSTVKDYSGNGLVSATAEDKGSWGEYIQGFFNSDYVKIQNYSNGGRSTRNFINEGSLNKILNAIGEGDYLFIQFAHNDCADDATNKADRYVPVGEPDANGVYPTTAGEKKATPAELASKKYGDTCYTWDCGGTYKWFLLQYVEAARAKGAIPVLVTPVSRMYYGADGKITNHHDDSNSGGNAYVKAMKQLADEHDVLLIDMFTLTKDMYEKAYTDCKESDKTLYGAQLMYTNDKTHCNKLGGVIEAMLLADNIVDRTGELSIGYAIKAPERLQGVALSGKTVFFIDKDGKLDANDITADYDKKADYWISYGQGYIDSLAKKSAALDPSQAVKPGGGSGSGSGEPSGSDNAVSEGKGSVEDTAAVTVSANAKGKKTYVIDVKPSDIKNGAAELSITLAKGSKVTLTGYNKKAGSTLNISDKKKAAVNGKGVLNAKGVTVPGTPVTVTYSIPGENPVTVTLSVTVIEPLVGQVIVAGARIDETDPKAKKKLTATVAADAKDIDIVMDMPINFKNAANANGDPDYSKLTFKNKGVLDGLTMELGSDNKVHIKAAAALKKGTVSVPFMINGKKFTGKIKVK